MFDQASRKNRGQKIINILSDFAGKKNLKKLRVLDLGCSTGIIDYFLANHFREIVGVDIDRNAIKFAQKNFKKSNLLFKTHDGLNLSFKKESFDLVICNHVYEHVSDSKKLFKEIFRILKPDGFCYLAATNKYQVIEPHYGLPFLSFLPKEAANQYSKATRITRRPKVFGNLDRNLKILKLSITQN
jgi:2-polyprenyl-3-methyl-5-hydroxy-6-metoxy-1,4-benzoquinol methylase